MQRDPLVYLDDILVACRNIQLYTADLTFEQFVNDQRTIDAVVRNFQVVGEATKNIPAELRARIPKIDWRAWQAFAMCWCTSISTSTLISRGRSSPNGLRRSSPPLRRS